MNLQQRILETLGEYAPVPAREMEKWLKGVDPMALECALRALMRAKKITLMGGRYDLVNVTKPAPPPSTSEAPPTAAEELDANLRPQEKTAYCTGCERSHPIDEFQISSLGKPFEQCRKHRRRVNSQAVTAAKKRAREEKGVPAASAGIEPAKETPTDVKHVAQPPEPVTDAAPAAAQQPDGLIDKIICKREAAVSAIEQAKADIGRLTAEIGEYDLYLALTSKFASGTQ